MKFLKTLLRKSLETAGYTVIKNGIGDYSPGSMNAGLFRLKELGIIPNLVIDIGAAQGTWTMKALEVWKNAQYELIEPLKEQEETLKALKTLYPNIQYHLAVAGENPGEVTLNISNDLDGSGVYGTPSPNDRKVPSVTIDNITLGKKGPFIIKFDTHGYEVPILKGAKESLSKTDALIIEVYGFRISPTCLVFHEISEYLDKQGFRLFDIVDILRRPKDNTFWQADAIYIRKDHPAFLYNHYA